MGDMERAIDQRNKGAKNRAVDVPMERVAHKMFTDDEKFYKRKRTLADSRMLFQVYIYIYIYIYYIIHIISSRLSFEKPFPTKRMRR